MNSKLEKGPVNDQMNPENTSGSVSVLLENDNCKVIKIAGSDGEGMMTLYQVFDGVTVLYNDFHMAECSSRILDTDEVLCIDHCREGRVELQSDEGSAYYMEKGDVRIAVQFQTGGAFRFPLSHYHGVSVRFQLSAADAVLKKELPGFSFDLGTLTSKFCSSGKPFLVHGDPAAEHLFYQLYQLPGRVQKDYFKVKVLELLLYLSSMEPDAFKVNRPCFFSSQVDKIRAIHDLITGDLTRCYTAEELSERFSISLTTMKRCFKSTYGSPIYAYLKQYRLREAADLLITRTDLKVAQISSMVGYDSPSKFTAAFHTAMGETPFVYRRMYGQKR